MIVYDQGGLVVHHGRVEDVLPTLPDASVDAVVTDPPYNLEFMGKEWDRHPSPVDFQRWCEVWGRECLRILKPGGHLLAFGGTRTHHRLVCGLEDAGFEIRDSIHWIYGSGFPKSLDVSKAIDKAAGAERAVIGRSSRHGGGVVGAGSSYEVSPTVPMITAPSTEDAQQWDGWGTALKPAHEPIVVARKPLAGTVAANVLEHGTGALNIDACRVNPGVPVSGGGGWAAHKVESTEGWDRPYVDGVGKTESHVSGRWPANVVLDEDAAIEMDQQAPDTGNNGQTLIRAEQDTRNLYGTFAGTDRPGRPKDKGGASRFFPVFRYEAKADTAERPLVVNGVSHPTVKPLALMRWLVRLVTQPGGVVLDPFAGSGTTLEACLLEGFGCVGVERDGDYIPLIRQRIDRRRDPVRALEYRGENEDTLFSLLGES